MSQIPVFVNRMFSLHAKHLFQDRKIKNNILRNLRVSSILSKKVSFTLSDIGEGIREVVVKEWFVNIGDKVSQFDNICEVQSDKASVTITSRYDGVITKLHYKIDDIALVGNPLIDLETDEQKGEETIVKQSTVEVPSPEIKLENIEPPQLAQELSRGEIPSNSSSDENTVLCIPSVRRLAKEHKIDLTKVNGTGKHGRILKEDVLRFMEQPQKIDTPQRRQQPETVRSTIEFGEDGTRIEPIRGFTKAMVKTMTAALKIPHFVYSDEIKVTKLLQLRQELKNHPEVDVKLTLLPFFVKAASNALQRYPIINSSTDENCENIIYKKHHNIGIAMATDQGLAVPVIKKVETLTVMEIARELNRLIKNGKSGNFAPDDLSGATFTVSNIGIVGGTYTKPVVMPPQVAIIALGRTQAVPKFDDDGNIIREDTINISGAADHRVIDGYSMANFVKVLKSQIEQPNLLFLNL